MNNWLKLAIAVTLGLLLYVGIHVYAIHSDGFKFVEQSIKASHSVAEWVGKVQRVSLSLLGSFKEKHVNSDQIVTMTVQAVGAQRTAIIDVKAVYKDGIWKIDSASIEGVPVDLTP